MAAETAEKDTSVASSGESSNQQSGLMIKIAGLVCLLMIVEGVGLYLFFGSSNSTAAKTADEEDRLDVDKQDLSDPLTDSATVEIGSFNCTNSRADPGSTIHVSIKLHAIVSRDQEEWFNQAIKLHKARVQQAIIQIARSSNLDDLNDPKLVTMKRLFREEINKVLRKSFIIEIVISDFRIMEQ